MLNLVRNNNSSKQAVELKSLEVEVNEIKHTFAELAMAYQNIKQRIIEQKNSQFFYADKTSLPRLRENQKKNIRELEAQLEHLTAAIGDLPVEISQIKE